jgi:hypothetical protein
MGQAASYSIDNGPDAVFSTSNTITDAIDGVTMTVSGRDHGGGEAERQRCRTNLPALQWRALSRSSTSR